MLKAVLGVVGGYVVMSVLVFASFSLAYLLMGADRAFRPGTHDVTPLWLIVSFVFSFIAAVVGGWVCATIARRSIAAKGFAIVVFILGLLLALSVLMTSDEAQLNPRGPNVGNIAAMLSARQPAWVALMNAVIGPVGILIGARLKERGQLVKTE
jgi:uncharacterized membrane protein